MMYYFFGVIAVIILIIVLRHFFQNTKKKKQYENALALYQAGKYKEAKKTLDNLNYKRKKQNYSYDLYKKCTEAEKELEMSSKYDLAMKDFEAGYYRAASTAFYELNWYKDSKKMMDKCDELIKKKRQEAIEEKYQKGITLLGEGNGIEAKRIFMDLKNYKDSAAMVQECEPLVVEQLYQQAYEEFNAGQYDDAASTFSVLDNYKDSCDMVQISNEKAYLKAKDLLQNGRSEKAYEILDRISFRYPKAAKLIDSDSRLSQISSERGASKMAFSEACMKEDSLSEMRSVGIKC